jgi:hypothetical protein
MHLSEALNIIEYYTRKNRSLIGVSIKGVAHIEFTLFKLYAKRGKRGFTYFCEIAGGEVLNKKRQRVRFETKDKSQLQEILLSMPSYSDDVFFMSQPQNLEVTDSAWLCLDLILGTNGFIDRGESPEDQRIRAIQGFKIAQEIAWSAREPMQRVS